MNLSNPEILKSLIENCIKGRSDAQQAFYKYFYGKMMGVCLRYAKNPDDAKDILHDGFIKVFNNLHKFKFDGSIEGWVRRIIVNTAIDSLRKDKNTYSIDENYDVVDEDSLPEEDNFYEQFSSNDIVEAIQNLSPAYKAVFNLYVIEGYSHQEIAEELNISIGSSKSNLAKAKRNLKIELLKKLKKSY